ncbi:RICIN domain-containing protein [Saccharomonospora halophila]|uniref:RICIN domain-containing protein n=1 Tax=Saccharomonospora halophila TaxID=129922 RepID=UPI000378C1E4|nr:RICIN domain-containing protein [Saccharomonospora halophila]
MSITTRLATVTGAALAATALAGSLATAPQASAADELSWRNVGTGECMVNGDDGVLRTIDCAPIASHMWATSGNSILTLRGLQSGLCLDDSAYGLRQFACNGMTYQQWEVTTFGDGDSKLRNVATGDCLEDAHVGVGGLRTFPCNSSSHQEWVWM